MVALAISPFRWLAKKFVYGPGEGRTKEETAKESIEYRAVGYPDLETPSKKRALSTVKWSGGIYQLTAIFADEAAMAILRDDTYAKKLGGGILTPATLGQPFVERLEKAGVKFETKLVED
ncbi:MAG: hypothetical protein M1824_003190 [Vezdaea acicularis]|nr:MAG: hypothetical protein M1824_003190 [Vezdaea acicularis]